MGDITCSIILFANEFWHHSFRNLLVYSVHVCVYVCVSVRIHVCMFVCVYLNLYTSWSMGVDERLWFKYLCGINVMFSISQGENYRNVLTCSRIYG